MSEHKYPYVADKNMYAAVMSACRYIRKTGYFNKAVSYNAQWYGVDPDELAKEIRKRQAVGQKKSTAKRQYKYFLVLSVTESKEGSARSINDIEVVRGISKESVGRRYLDSDFRRTRAADYGGYYAPYYYHDVVGEYDTKEEAEMAKLEFRREEYEY